MMNSKRVNQKRHEFFFQKSIVITGASSGVGRCLAYWYLNHGAKVTLVGQDVQAMKVIGSEFPGQAMIVCCQLVKDKEVLDLKKAVIEKMGGIDILINCAGK